MATFQVIGQSLVSPEDVFNKKFSGELTPTLKFDELKSLRNSITLFDNSELLLNEIPDARMALLQEFTPNFKEIGIGKPLSIEISTVYTGKYKKFLGGRKDVIVVSGVKNSQTFAGTSRAINMIANNVDENAFLNFNSFDDGTPIVYYSPAMDSDNSVVTFEIMFDNFDKGLFETIAGLFNTAAGIPVFLPAAPFLLGGSQLIKIGADLGDALFSGDPNLSGSIPIVFDSPIIPPTQPKEFVIYNDKDKGEFSNLEVKLFDTIPQLRLVNKNDKSEYNGPAPYVIVILNGAPRQDLEKFAPTIASATLLKKFYGGDKAGEITGVLQDAMQLYNDLQYKTKGEKLKKQIDSLPADSKEVEKLKNLYEAYAANIKSDDFKLPKL